MQSEHTSYRIIVTCKIKKKNEFHDEAEKSANNEEALANMQQQYNCHTCKKKFNQFDKYICHFETC